MLDVKSGFGKFIGLLSVLLLSLGITFTVTYSYDEPSSPDTLIGELKGEGQSEKPIHPGLSSSLSEVYKAWQRDAEAATREFAPRGFSFRGDRVDVMLMMHDEGLAWSALDAIRSMGGKSTAHYKTWIDASVPVDRLVTIADLPGVSLIQRPIPIHPVDSHKAPIQRPLFIGTALTQGVAASNADDWHSAGYSGSGVKVAVLDTFKDYPTAQANGDLPSAISTYGSLDYSSRHGTAVAEIIYDMAPGVSFTFASPTTVTEMADYIVALSQAGNQIISSSIAFYNAEPGDGTGPVSDAINTAKGTYGTLYVQAAGNQAKYHWDGTFHDSSPVNDYHEFVTGDEINWLGYLSSGSTLYINLRWNAWPTTDQDYDLHIVYWNGSYWEIVDSSMNAQTGSQPPTESVYYTTSNSGDYGIMIENCDANGTHVLDLMGHNSPWFEWNVSDRSLVDPATPSGAFSAAAIDVSTFNLEYYSSWGPTHGPGGGLDGGLKQSRIAGFANVDTWAYGPGYFNGTSAATPHVSGAAALIFDAYPTFSAQEAMTFLESHAIDQGTVGYDVKYGAGRLYLGDPPDHLFFPIITNQ